MSVMHTLQELDIDSLEFDPKNPRLPKVYQNSGEKEVIEWMLQDSSLLDLISSIAINGYFYGEPIIVIKKENTDNYIVVEGNRRLAAVKLLNNPNLATSKKNSISNILSEENIKIPKKIPAFILTDRKEAIDYLGFRHVTGVKSWGALQKAKYLYQLYESSFKTDNNIYNSIARRIGSKSSYVKQIIVAYKLYLIIEENNFFNIPNLDEETFEFSQLYGTATRYTNIQNFINVKLDTPNDEIKEVNKNNLRELTKWLFEKNSENFSRVNENRDFPLLNAIVVHEKALDLFRKGEKNLKEAAELTSLTDNAFSDYLSKSYNYLIEAQRVLALIESSNDSDIEKIIQISRASRDILSILNGRKAIV